MRIASNQYHATMNTALQTANAGLTRVMQQMASGERVMVSSDDTIATVRLARLTREEAALEQYRANVGALKTRLSANEAKLDSVKEDLTAMRDLLVWAADGANTAEDMKAMAGSLESLRDSLFFSFNSRNAEGKYLFSGTATDVATLTDTGGLPGSRYTQDPAVNTGTQDVAVGDGVAVAANIALKPLALDSFLNQLDDTADRLKNGSYTTATVSSMLVQVDKVLDDVAAQISVLGGRQNVIATLDDNHGAISLANRQAMIDLGQLDYAEAAVRLNGYTLAVQATQKAYAKVSSLSLFNVL